MRYPALAIGFIFILSGCTQFALRNNTAQITNTLTDLQFQQVLDNVARFQDNPDTVPSFAVVTAGTVAVNDQAGTGLSATYSPTLSSAQQGGGHCRSCRCFSPLVLSGTGHCLGTGR